MEEKRERFEVRGNEEAWKGYLQDGTEEGLPRVPAEDVLNAIAEGRDIDIEFTVIEGNLDIRVVADRLEQSEDGKAIIQGDVSIKLSEIRGDAYFRNAQFSGNADFNSAQFSGYACFIRTQFSFRGDADFSKARFSRDADFNSAQFSGYAYFIDTQFSTRADFRSAQFSLTAVFMKPGSAGVHAS